MCGAERFLIFQEELETKGYICTNSAENERIKLSLYGIVRTEKCQED